MHSWALTVILIPNSQSPPIASLRHEPMSHTLHNLAWSNVGRYWKSQTVANLVTADAGCVMSVETMGHVSQCLLPGDVVSNVHRTLGLGPFPV